MIPVEWEAVYSHRIQALQDALTLHIRDKERVNGRDAAKHPQQARTFGGYRLCGEFGHVGERPPFGIDLKGPVRLVIRLVPEHHGFYHGHSLVCDPLVGLDKPRGVDPSALCGGKYTLPVPDD
jgi:hypothetical protein